MKLTEEQLVRFEDIFDRVHLSLAADASDALSYNDPEMNKEINEADDLYVFWGIVDGGRIYPGDDSKTTEEEWVLLKEALADEEALEQLQQITKGWSLTP